MIKNLLYKTWKSLQAVFTWLFGHITWQPPRWLQSLTQKTATRSSPFWQVTFSAILILLISITSYIWYQKRPHPDAVIAHITTPSITPLSENQLIPDDLTLDFGTSTNGFTTQSVAPLASLHQEVKQGVSINPPMPGRWVWQSDSRLVFSPQHDWPANQTYRIHFNKYFFAANANMATLDYSFTTQPFQATISHLSFYQDPVNPERREVVATLSFNYPVDPTSLNQHITLTLPLLQKGKIKLNAQSFRYTLTYDTFKRTAYLHSEPLPLPDVERFLTLSLSKGIQSSTGNGITTKDLTQQVLIPDAGSYLKFNTVTASIVRNERDQPEQVLTLESTLGITASELEKNMAVYLLPKDYPATTVETVKKDYAWQNPGEVTPAILDLATSLTLQPLPAERDYATLHSYQFNAEAERFLYVKIHKGTRGFGDYRLATDYAAIVKVPAYPKEIGFLHKGALLSLSGEKKLSVTVRGIPAVKFTIARVLPDDINQLVTQTNGTFSDPHFLPRTLNENNISEIFSEIKTFDENELQKQQYTALDLGKYLNTPHSGGPLGLFLLKARAWDITRQIPLGIDAARLILITDLGLIVKDNRDGSHDLFVQSITSGNPVAQVILSVLGKNGLAVMNQVTDSMGHAHFPPLNDFVEEREPTVYLARLGNDVSFIPFHKVDRQLNYSRFNIGGVVSDNQDQPLTAYIFTERGIYRPGDTAHIAMIVKQVYANPPPAGLPLEITIIDPRGVMIQDQKVALDATGYLTFDLATRDSSPTGQYTVNVFIVKDNHLNRLIGSTSLRLAEFLPDRLRITARLSSESAHGWIHPAALAANVSVMNLYGTPAANRMVSARILLTPQVVTFPEFPQYTFIDPLLNPKKPPKTFTDTLPNAKTDAEGQAHFDLKLERFDKATYQLTFFAEGFEAAGGRSVSTQTTALVSPLAYLVGYKPDGDLHFIKQNESRRIHLIAINPHLALQALTPLQLSLYEQHPISTLVKKPDGTYQYQSVMQTRLINQTPLTLPAQGINYPLSTARIGDFVMTITDSQGTELARINYTVVGASQEPLPAEAELEVKLKNTTFSPNQPIEMEITSPYAGTGLITLERDKVYAYRWFKSDTTRSLQTILIPPNFQGDGYVNVTFVRDWNSPDILMRPLSYSVVPFSVTHEAHDIHIHLEASDIARPGEPLTISYRTDKPAKIILFAVDEGILQVTHYSTPSPSAFFFQKHALEVTTQQIVDQILPKFIAERELSAVGGDQSKRVIEQLLNPFKRKTDLPVVYWSGILNADTTLRQVTYHVPDYFNGSLRLMAVAASADAVGETEKSALIQGDFIITPNVPTFVAPGDEFEISAAIANHLKGSGKDAPITLQIAATPQLEVLDTPTRTLNISEGEEKTFSIKLRAKSMLGPASITWIAIAKNNPPSKITATLSVRPASPLLTTLQSGFATDAKRTLSLDRTLYPEHRIVQAAASTSPLILVAGLERYLSEFPFGCTEQLISKAFPLLAMAEQPWFTKNTQTITTKVQTTIDLLIQRQLSNGSFSYWPNMGNNQSNPFGSVYAMHFLTEARGHGYRIPSDTYSNGLAYLKEIARTPVFTLEEARLQAYAIYLLTRNEIITTNYLTNLQLYLEKNFPKQWRQDITAAYIAATYQLLKDDTAADNLINAYHPFTQSSIATTDFYNTNIANAQYLYLIARHFPNLLPLYGDKLVHSLVLALNSGQINTLLSSKASLALSSYAQSYQLRTSDALGIQEILTDGTQQTLAASDSRYQHVTVSENAKKIIFLNPTQQPYFYQLTQTGFDKNPSTQTIKEGIEVYRDYRDSQGKSINTVELGQEVEVHLKVRALANRELSNIAIVDLLPGGFEVVPDSVVARSLDYSDIREDRTFFFGTIGPNATEMVYRLKATNAGSYTIPPVTALSLYDPAVQARNSELGTITVIRK